MTNLARTALLLASQALTIAMAPSAYAQVPKILPLAGAGCSVSKLTARRSFDVGPGQHYAELQQVPWLSLQAGDVVNIFYRPQPYRAKLLIRAQGSARAPVIINGVTDAECHRPIISGEQAVPSDDAVREGAYNQWTESLATILIWGSWGQKPRFIEIRNLMITGARDGVSYRKQDHTEGHFMGGSAGIHGVAVEDIVVENCEITGNGNGVFVNTRNDTEQDASYRITLRRNLIHDNGNVGSWLEHNVYVQAVRALYEGNYIGQLIPGAVGSSLKDRSSGTIIRYNTVIAAARALDLVETDGGSTTVFRDPQYHDAWVYGNIIVSDHTLPAVSSASLIHWGGDLAPRYYHTGTLHFYHNTVVTRGDRGSDLWRIHVFDMPGEQTVELRGNVFWHTGTASFELGKDHGRIVFAGTNWISQGWEKGNDSGNDVKIETPGRIIEGIDPGLDSDFTPAEGSALREQGGPAPPDLNGRWIDQEITGLGSFGPRPAEHAAPDLGAIERR